MIYDLQRISKNIRMLRYKKKWNFRIIESNTGIKRKRLIEMEKAKVVPKTEELYRLSRIYDVTIDDLVFKDLE